MHDHRFDALTRLFAAGTTRRAAMRFFAGAAAATFIVDQPGRTAAGALLEAPGEGQATNPPGDCAVLDCPSGTLFSPETCACVCDVQCQPNFAPDPNHNCACFCTLGDFYQCPRTDQVYDDGLCACVCPDDNCPGDSVQDPETCLCFCRGNIQCADGEAPDPTTCECVCNRNLRAAVRP